jgi:hypothetical protein
MATQYSNKPIVTDGLVYALDFGNQKSYVSGSTTANSLLYNPVPATFSTVPAGDYQGLAAAYSVRKVVSSYTGSAMMVQSASVSQSIGFDADGNLDTASLEAFAGSGDAFVKIWFDQSGNGRDATQTTLANQPQIVSSGSVITLNGKPSIENSSGKQLAIASSNIFAINFTTFVINPTNANNNATLFRQTYQNSTLIRSWTGGGRFRHNNGAEITYTDTNTLLIQTQTVTPAIQIFKNGILKASAGTNGVQTPLNVESYLLNSGFNEFFGGKCSEAIFYTSDQSSNRTSIENDINSYYSIYSPLPSSPIPGLTSGLANFESPDALLTNQTFNGFSYDQGNSTIMYVGETKGTSSLFTQDTNLSVVATTSSVGFGSTSNNLGRTYPVTGLKHVTLRFSSGSVDCFVNGILVPANSVFPTGSSVSGGKFAIPVYTGSLGLVQVYNRPLTGDEIWNNYQLTAPRYGLGALQNKPYTLDDNAYLFLSQSGITDPIITGSIDTFVRGLKSNNLWDKMIAIYPFVGTGSDGTNLTGSHRWNLKEPSLVTYPLSFTGSWNGSTSGSAPSGSNTNISTQVAPSTYYPFFNTQSAHISILSYDTPVSSSYLMGTGMTEDLAISTLAGDYGTPAAAYSVRKVRTAYSGALMDVRRSYDNVTQSIGYVETGDLDTGSLVNFVNAIGENSPGEFEGLAAAYSLRKVSASYDGSAIDVRRIWDNTTSSIGFDSNGNLNTGSLLNFTTSGSNILPYSNDFTQADWTKYDVQITASAVLGPYGLGSGSFVNETSTNSSHVFNENINPVNISSIHTISCFVKKQERRYVGLAFAYNSANHSYVTFDLDTTSSVSSGSAGTGYLVASSSINYVTDGWFRISLIGTVGLNDFYPRFYLTKDTTGYQPIYVGEPGTGSYIYGFQYTTGSTVQPYIETTGTARYNVGNTSSFGYVTQWYDQSGNNRHATQTATGSQPLIVSSGSLVTENGRPAIRSNQSQLNLSSNFNVGKTYTILAALQNTGYTDTFLGTGTPYQYLYYWQDASTTRQLVDGSVGITFPGVGTDFKVLTTVRNATVSSSLYKNSNLLGTGSFTVNNDFSFRNLLGDNYNPPLYNFIGDVSEILVYNSDQSGNRSLIENNINNYYNIYTGSNHGFVARWYDQSGNNRHATQTTAGSQPVIVLSGSILTTNNKPNLNFDGVDDNFSLVSTISSNTAYTAIEVNRRTDTSVNSVGFASPTGQPYVNLFLATTLYFSTQRLGTGYFGTYSINSTNQQLLFSIDDKSSNLKSYLNQNLVINSLSPFGTTTFTDYNNIGIRSGYTKDVKQELIFYSSDQSSNREAISYGINNYYNIYPQTSSFATSSFTIQTTPTAISGAINNKLTSGIPSSGPLGLITVSRTGSNSLTIARNGVTSSFAVPASGALSTGIYLGAINNNGLALGNSPLNLSFASVGTGLTGAELGTFNELVGGLNINLRRAGVLNTHGALAAYSLRLLDYGYTGPAVTVRRTSDNTTSSIGFDSNRDLDITSLLTFTGTSSAFVTTWHDQSGNNKHISQTVTGSQPLLVRSGSVVTAKTFETLTNLAINPNNNNTKPAIYFNGAFLDLGTSIGSITQASYYLVFNLAMPSINDYSVMQTNTTSNNDRWKWLGANNNSYLNMFSPDGSSRRFFEAFGPTFPVAGTTLWSAFHGPGSNMSIFLQGSINKGTDTSLAFSSGSMFRVGRGSVAVLPGSIQEIILYPDNSTSRKDFMENNINNYYQIY